MSNKEPIVVAIDGPSASGKSTVSKLVAKKLGFIYVDSGAFYRGMTWKTLREGLDPTHASGVVELMQRIKLECYVEDQCAKFTIDEEDPWSELRSEPVRESVADIAAIPEVRSFMVAQLRSLARFGDIVMEGRDIGTVVFPASPFKFYLDADPEERARRRYEELRRVEELNDVGKVLDSLRRRDQKDSTRPTAPLQIALGAYVINTTRMSIEQVVGHIVDVVRRGVS